MTQIQIIDQYPDGTRTSAEDRTRYKALAELPHALVQAYGATPYAAVGNLVTTHAEAFNVRVTG